jgi:hypothetical protein
LTGIHGRPGIAQFFFEILGIKAQQHVIFFHQAAVREDLQDAETGPFLGIDHQRNGFYNRVAPFPPELAT